MTSDLISIGVAGAILGTSAIVFALVLIMMIGEINRKRADDNQVAYLGVSLPKVEQVYREYRRQGPKALS